MITKQIIAVIVALVETLFTWQQTEQNGNLVVYIFVFAAFFMLAKKVLEIENKRMWITCSSLAAIFMITQVIGLSINTDFTIDHILQKSTLINAMRIFCICTYAKYTVI